jgi:signal transduction histidine kinase
MLGRVAANAQAISAGRLFAPARSTESQGPAAAPRDALQYLTAEDAQRATADAVLERLTFVQEATEALGDSLHPQTTAQQAANAVVPRLADWCIVELPRDSDENLVGAYAAADASLEPVVWQLLQSVTLDDDRWLAAQAVRSARSVVVDDVDDEWLSRSVSNPEYLGRLQWLKPRSIVALPLIARGQALGAMTLGSTTPHRYDATTVTMATVVARRCALAIANARLHRETDEALRARETFLSVASHELGGPIARLKLHVEVVLLARARHSLDEALLERSLTSIEKATNRLATITQDLLNVSGWARGDLAMNMERADLGKIVREVAQGYRRGSSDTPRLVLRTGRRRHMVQVDTSRIEQVCENLLDNAFKYSPSGGEVQVSVTTARGGELLQVRDTGIGLPPNSHELIFEPFGRAANAEERSVSGMGLGLYICRRIVDSHGGRIWAESPGEDQGTTISVWLPGTSS